MKDTTLDWPVICGSGFGLHPDQAGKLRGGFPGGSGFPAAILCAGMTIKRSISGTQNSRHTRE
jgi:hypothetical protein